MVHLKNFVLLCIVPKYIRGCIISKHWIFSSKATQKGLKSSSKFIIFRLIFYLSRFWCFNSSLRYNYESVKNEIHLNFLKIWLRENCLAVSVISALQLQLSRTNFQINNCCWLIFSWMIFRMITIVYVLIVSVPFRGNIGHDQHIRRVTTKQTGSKWEINFMLVSGSFNIF